MAAANAHGAWARALLVGCVTGVTAFDLTAASHTINHDLLFNKLREIGVSPNGVDWFRDYLKERQERVKYSNALSSPCPAYFGVS